MKFYELKQDQFILFSNLLILKKTAIRLWQEGTPSTRFCRMLHNDYQIIFNEDIPSHDNFYNLSHPQNKPMIDLLRVLGFEYTQFGIAFPVFNHDVTKLIF